MDEKAVSLKKKVSSKKKTVQRLLCIIHCETVNSKLDVKPLTEQSWKKINETVHERKLVAGSSSSVYDDICDNIPTEPNFRNHGFHRECYKRFTCIKGSRKRKLCTESPCEPSKKKRHPSGQKVLFPSDQCIICGKECRWIVRKSKGVSKRDRLVKCVTLNAEESIKLAAEKKDDTEMLRKVAGEDLVAKEAHYHEECRRAYIKILTKQDQDENFAEESECHAAHTEAFQYLCEYIQKEIVKGASICRISMLKEKYILFLRENHSKFYNPHYKIDKLKSKIMKSFGNSVHFFQPKYGSEILYSDEISTTSAVEHVYETSSSEIKRLESAAMLLRCNILEKQREYAETEWPPTTEYLNSSVVPLHLTLFLQKLLTPTKVKSVSEVFKRKINSIAQDICYCVTKGTWYLPKHLLLAMSVHHLTGSAELITMLNRLGHCISYSKVLELETSIAENILISDSVLPPTMLQLTNVCTHFCWDNFDLTEETPTGAGTTHSTHGIAIMEHLGKKDIETETARIQKSKRRSIQFSKEDLTPCTITKKPEPNIQTIHVDHDVHQQSVTEDHCASDFLWLLSRHIAQERNALIPGWRGWLHLTTDKQAQEFTSVVEYLRPIHHPATENATIQEALNRSIEASNELGQTQTVITFDLATAKRAYSLVWNSPDKYADVFIRLGSFHIICAYFSCVGKVLENSGFEDIVLESGLCASGSLNGVVSGKHYNRALRVHIIFLEALERLFLERFLKTKCADGNWNRIKDVIKNLDISLSTLRSCQCNSEFASLFCDCQNYRSALKSGLEGLTPEFWIQHMDRIWLVLKLIRSLKENDFDLYRQTLTSMIPLFFATNHHNYARYLTLYVASLENIDASHPIAAKHLKECALSVNRTKERASGTAVDQTIEQTINKHAKSRGGIVGFSRNLQAYDRWCLTRHERAAYTSAMFESCGMVDNPTDNKKDLLEAEILKGQNDVVNTMSTICNFINPFDIYEHDSLVCLSSGIQASKEIAKDLTEMDQTGHAAYDTFVKQRLCNKETHFHDPVKKNKFQTFASMKKTATVINKHNKEVKITAQRNVYAQLLMVAQHNNIDLQKLFTYPLAPVPWSLATGDGMPAKTDKAVLLHELEKKSPQSLPFSQVSGNDVYVLDGNVILHSVKFLPETFGQLARQILKGLPPVSVIHFVTDTYKDSSIKSAERLRRGTSEPIILKGSLSKVPRNFQKFLSNSDNKKNLIKLLKNEWSNDFYAAMLKNKELYFVCEHECVLITSEDGVTTDTRSVPELQSSQEEADTRMMLHAKFVNDRSKPEKLIIRSTDTDVFLLLLHFANVFEQCKNIFFDTGVGDKRRLIDINTLKLHLEPDVLKALLAFHAFTGCDSTSSFVRQGKQKPFKLLQKNKQMLSVFHDVGESDCLQEKTIDGLEKFTCMMYGSESSTINQVRFLKARERFHVSKNQLFSEHDNADLSLLPPCRSSLVLHIQRVHYQTLIWKRSLQAFQNLAPPEHNGWQLKQDQLVINWGDKMFPKELEEVLMTEEEEQDDEDGEDDDDEYDVEDIEFSDDFPAVFDE